MATRRSRIVLITGASAGIGRATAVRLARDGASLVICARRAEKLRETAAEIERSGGQVLAQVADVTRPGDMRDLVARGLDRFGRLDAAVCNAGFGVYGSIDTVEPAQMQKVLDVNYMGTYHTIRAALPVFRRQGFGHIVVVSSIVGRRGVPFTGAYAATKFAQVGLAEALRTELKGTGIHVSTVLPISTPTEFSQVMVRESGFATRASGPRQQVEDVAKAIALGLARPRPEIYPYRPAKLLTVLNAVAPGLCDTVVKRWGRTPLPPNGGV